MTLVIFDSGANRLQNFQKSILPLMIHRATVTVSITGLNSHYAASDYPITIVYAADADGRKKPGWQVPLLVRANILLEIRDGFGMLTKPIPVVILHFHPGDY